MKRKKKDVNKQNIYMIQQQIFSQKKANFLKICYIIQSEEKRKEKNLITFTTTNQLIFLKVLMFSVDCGWKRI